MESYDGKVAESHISQASRQHPVKVRVMRFSSSCHVIRILASPYLGLELFQADFTAARYNRGYITRPVVVSVAVLTVERRVPCISRPLISWAAQRGPATAGAEVEPVLVRPTSLGMAPRQINHDRIASIVGIVAS
jgi:hypothetical protein